MASPAATVINGEASGTDFTLYSDWVNSPPDFTHPLAQTVVPPGGVSCGGLVIIPAVFLPSLPASEQWGLEHLIFPV
jgi:hypothetical protein